MVSFMYGCSITHAHIQMHVHTHANAHNCTHTRVHTHKKFNGKDEHGKKWSLWYVGAVMIPNVVVRGIASKPKGSVCAEGANSAVA